MKFLDHPAVPLLGRLLMVYIFATSGIAKVFGWQANIEYMSTRNLPMIPVLLAVAAIIEVGGSISLITGYQARIAGFVMSMYTIVLTVIFHNYWAASEHMAGMQETHFRKNIAIAGGLLMLAYCGPGAWALGKEAGGETACAKGDDESASLRRPIECLAGFHLTKRERVKRNF